MINLKRRTDRFQRMKYNFDMLGIDFTVVPAVDGRQMNQDYVEENKIKMLPEFSEPYHGRPLTMGEIGCFMSHYNIWKLIVESDLEKVLIFEDDIRFEPYFLSKLDHLIRELDSIRDQWDLVYIGRKILHNSHEDWLEG